MLSSCECTPRQELSTETRGAEKSVSYFRPDVDVIEGDDEFTVVADLPGAKADSISIEFEKGTLTLTASVTPRETRPLVQEYAVGDYRRVFRIADAIDSEAISADYTRGVLRITLPKAAAAKARKIQVRAG